MKHFSEILFQKKLPHASLVLLFLLLIEKKLFVKMKNVYTKDHSMVETRRLKNVVIFIQTILSFVLSRKIVYCNELQVEVINACSIITRVINIRCINKV